MRGDARTMTVSSPRTAAEAVRAYARDPNGTPPLKDRPTAIRSGTIARIPPQQGAL